MLYTFHVYVLHTVYISLLSIFTFLRTAYYVLTFHVYVLHTLYILRTFSLLFTPLRTACSTVYTSASQIFFSCLISLMFTYWTLYIYWPSKYFSFATYYTLRIYTFHCVDTNINIFLLLYSFNVYVLHSAYISAFWIPFPCYILFKYLHITYIPFMSKYCTLRIYLPLCRHHPNYFSLAL